MSAKRFDSEDAPPVGVEVLVQHDNGTTFLAAYSDEYRAPTWVDSTREVWRIQPCANTWRALGECDEDDKSARLIMRRRMLGKDHTLSFVTARVPLYRPPEVLEVEGVCDE